MERKSKIIWRAKMEVSISVKKMPVVAIKTVHLDGLHTFRRHVAGAMKQDGDARHCLAVLAPLHLRQSVYEIPCKKERRQPVHETNMPDRWELS